jgi:hypothetical protein
LFPVRPTSAQAFTFRVQPIDLKPSQNHSLYSQPIVLSAKTADS